MANTPKNNPADKLWGGRFSEATDDLVEAFGASVHYDQRLYAQDIRGSQAHATMLGKVGVLTESEVQEICDGLEQIKTEIETGDFQWQAALEDVHMNIESRLTDLIGDAGKKLHTGRSRNDQVATDLRLYLRDATDLIVQNINDLRNSLLTLAEQESDSVMPGFTHLQVAQPVSFGHHLLAWHEMLLRDAARFMDARKRINVLPLGAAALAGTTYPIDRQFVAEQLGFDAVTENSLDSVSDRDFVIEFVSACAVLMMHFSRISEELVLWASPMFGFVDLPDRYCTGSSIMPQKKNPDVPELTRGKTGRVYGDLMALLTLMKSQPLAYNRDNQEDKEPVFDCLDTVLACLGVFNGMLPNLKVNRDRCREAAGMGYSTATELADYLVRKGLPFRDAHEVVGKTVALCVERGCDLNDLNLADLQDFSDLIEADVFDSLTVEGAIAARDHIGGTAPNQVRAAVARAKDSSS